MPTSSVAEARAELTVQNGSVARGAFTSFDDVGPGSDWGRWCALTKNAPPYLLPEFFALNIPLIRGEPLLATASRADCLIGALPLVLDRRTLCALRSDHTPRYDYWGEPDGLDAIWEALRRDRRWSELFLQAVPATSLLATRLPALARVGGCPAILLPAARQRYFALPGFEARLDSRFRMGLRRCERKAGSVELESISSPGQADFEEAWAIEGMSWKGRAGTNISSDPHVIRLYQQLGRTLGPRGMARLNFLRVNGSRIAVLFTVEDDRTVYALKIGHDPKHSALSPGHLLVWKTSSEAERRGMELFDFVGQDSEWKAKWTDDVQELVSVRVYRRCARGLLQYTLREQIKPKLPESMRDLRAPLRRGCQLDEAIGKHCWFHGISGRILRNVRTVPADHRPTSDPLGEPSRFAPGTWVRVKDVEVIRQTLESRGEPCGSAFPLQQTASCGHVHRVHKVVRRIRDDRGRYHPVDRTVILDGVYCGVRGSGHTTSGPYCHALFRDDWLEAAPRPRLDPSPPSKLGHARVRGVDEIMSRVDLWGRRDGLKFMSGMARFAGQRLPILARLSEAYERRRWVETRAPIVVLDGAVCSGSIEGEPGPCDRACALLWHADWLLLEDDGR